MPRSKNDGLYFKDYEKLIFGDETENQSVMYHNGSNLVFENITISGAQGPAGPPGAGVPGNTVTSEDGQTGVLASSYMYFWQNGTNRMLLDSNTVVVGENPSLENNWGALMVKSTGPTYTSNQEGFKLIHFGDGYNDGQRIDFVKSSSLDVGITKPTRGGDFIGSLNWSTFNYDHNGITEYARIYGVDEFSSPSINLHRMSLWLQTKTDAGVWQTNLKAVGGASGGIKLRLGVEVDTILNDMDVVGDYNMARTLLTADGVARKVSQIRGEFDEALATISGTLPSEVFDSTITGARVDCENSDGITPKIKFSIFGNEVGRFDEHGFFHLANSVGIAGITENINDQSFSGDTLPTTAAVKNYVDNANQAGDVGGFLITNTGDTFTLGVNGITTDFSDGFLNFEINRTLDIIGTNAQSFVDAKSWPRSRMGYGGIEGTKLYGSHFLFGTKKFNQLKFFSTVDEGCNMWNYEEPSTARTTWASRTWSQELWVHQKHTVIVADEAGSSLGLVGWDTHQTYGQIPTHHGPNISFMKMRGTPEAPLHVLQNTVIGRISWDYAALDNNQRMDRGGWIECRTGIQFGYADPKWQESGGTTPARVDFHYSENEIVIGASPYVHFGRIRLRTKLFFDDGSENFVSGIIQSNQTPVLTVSSNVGASPWGTSVPTRYAWGMDHVMPTAQWVLDQIDSRIPEELVNSIGYNSKITSDPYCYNCTDDHRVFCNQGGVHIATGVSRDALIFSVSGEPTTVENSDQSTWGARLISNSYTTRLFLENYNRKNGYNNTIYTNQFVFFRSMGGRSMGSFREEGSAIDVALENVNNGACTVGTIIGEILAIGQARGNGRDHDPCTYWSAYQAGAKIQFQVTEVTQDVIYSDILFGTNEQYLPLRLDNKGCVHIRGGESSGLNKMTVPIGTCDLARRKGILSVTGGDWPKQFVDGGQSTVSLWGQTPSISFSSGFGHTYVAGDPMSVIYQGGLGVRPGVCHIASKLIQVMSKTGGYVWKEAYGLPGLGIWMYSAASLVEEETFLVTNNRNVIIGDKFLNEGSGRLIIAPATNGPSQGISIMDPTNSYRYLKMFIDTDKVATINCDLLPSGSTGAESMGNSPMMLNRGLGKVYIGFTGLPSPADGNKLIVHGNVIPATDNASDLGTAFNRWDDVYATNGTIQVSDAREKEEIKKETLGISFINKLNPVAFKRLGGVRQHHGLISQEVETLLKTMGKGNDFFAGVIYNEEADTYGLRYEEFIAPMIKAIQELSLEVDRLKKIVEV